MDPINNTRNPKLNAKARHICYPNSHVIKKKKNSIGLILKRKRKKENDTCMEKKIF